MYPRLASGLLVAKDNPFLRSNNPPSVGQPREPQPVVYRVAGLHPEPCANWVSLAPPGRMPALQWFISDDITLQGLCSISQNLAR